MEKQNPVYLVMVTASANNNKYYRMTDNGDGTWVAEYGRVGGPPQRRQYAIGCWHKKYTEKVKKGYVDQSDLVKELIPSEKTEQTPGYKEIENRAIAEIVSRLQAMARKAIKENYTISASKVTQAMVDEAQDILTSLLDVKDINEFNELLLKLFTTIPRKMANVKTHIASSNKDFPQIIKREQDLLDVMKGQVVQKTVEEKVESGEKHECTILEHLGLEFEECTDEDIRTIKEALGSCSNKFHKAWVVKNLKTEKRYNDFVEVNNIKDERLLFHGSRNENWWSIINTGLVLRPTNAVITGKMFGYGLYFAPKAQKSLGYTSINGSYWAGGNQNFGMMTLMKVAYGVPYDAYSFDYKYKSLDYNGLQRYKPGANCLHAHAGSMLRNDEIIVYKEDQTTIKYLVELRNN